MPSTSRRWSAFAAIAVLAFCVAVLAAPGQPPTMQDAQKLFDQKNYKEAATAYQALVEAQGPQWRDAAEQLVLCDLRLQLYDDALKAAEDYVRRTGGTPYEARAERLTGNLYMLLPHYGTRAGGVFYRGEYRQGIYLQSWRYDKNHAVEHLERARDLYAKYDADAAALPEDLGKGWHEERIDCDFDLANTVARFSIYDDQAYYWFRWWGERDEQLAETAGEKDFDEGYNWWEWTRKRPIGLRIGPDGQPLWPEKPAAYAPGLGDDQKLLFLFEEVRGLDGTEGGKYASLSTYRQAMLARKRFGMDRLNSYASTYNDGTGQPLQKELEKFNPYELGDGEALVLAGGQVRRVTLPAQFDVLALLRTVYDRYPKGGVADQARYGAGLYYQSRQQYTKALDEYAALHETSPESTWTGAANDHITRIKAPQVQISQMGVQPPGRPAEVQVSYRNLSKVYFVARKYDVEGLLKELHSSPADSDQLYWRWQQTLTNWPYLLITDYGRNNEPEVQLVAKYLGEEVIRWSDQVKDDGSHRYAEAVLQAPIKERGVYVVYAYVQEPPAADAQKKGLEARLLGQSRAVTALTDLAFVGKKTSGGNLYYVADAVSGAPVHGASLDILETWNTWDQKTQKRTYHQVRTALTSDDSGMAVLKEAPQPGANVHLIVSAPEGRLAWSGMDYFYRYSPSRQREGMFAYAITDRPVYRPEQTVRYKVWLRQSRQGVLQNIPHQEVQITIYDPRGNEVQKVTKRTDDFGGLDGELVLGEEPTLGVYRLQVRGQQYAGGENFRVEEYKKPEFEVTVEPDTTHAKLGSKVGAVINARYYFGAPVTEGTVSYKVFREEFTYTSYPQGRWDWLYGPGYGYPWYSYEWFPWWGKLRTCWAPPVWWWGYRPSSPVRELVMQGTGPIGADGTLKLQIDTAPALKEHPDRDHRYVIEAEVTDSSRRTIAGEGDVKVTRQAFYALINSDRGYYRPREEMHLTVRCVTPDGKPVQTEGVVTLSRILFRGPHNADIRDEEIRRWKASTDADGVLSFRFSADRSDLLKISFVAPDQWGGTVEGYGLVWVCGDDFNGRLFRFNELELITDKRTYAPGDVCHLMINTANPDSYVLFADAVDNGALLNYRLLHLTNGHAIVDVPVKEGDKPNFFVEATTISDMHVYQQAERINVPPAGHVLDVTVSSDKAEYKPGEEATVHVKAVTADGKPADVQVALGAFDKSILYIQPEFTPAIAGFYYGQLRYHSPSMTTNLLDQFATQGIMQRPFQYLYPLPPAWQGFWGPEYVKWWSLAQEEFDKLKGSEQQLRFGGAVRGLGGAADGAVLERAAAAPAAPMAANAVAAGAPALAQADRGGAAEKRAEGGAPPLVQPTVRQEFADTAVWLPSLLTGPAGEATATFKMPENLTTWKLNAYAMSRETQVGQGAAEAVTTKDLLVRLEAPRFFLETDEVVLSAIVHNYLKAVKTAHVSIELPAENLSLMDGYPAAVDVNVPENGQARVDWRVKVIKEGQAAVTVKALTNEESDAMRMTFPVLVHGMTRQDSYTGAMRPELAQSTQTVEFTVPEQRRPELTRLEVQFAPSLVGAMLDALPYCLDYPYGCTEQTVSRFLPAVLTLKTLQNMGVRLEDLKDIRGRMAEVRRVEKGQHIRVYADSPIFDSAELQKIIDKGLKRIAEMQHGDGGWAWWTQGESSPYLTSYVLNALITAQQADVAADQGMIDRGVQFLSNWERSELQRETWAPGEMHAFVAYVLSLNGQKAGDCVERLFTGRDELNLYGKALLAMALANLNDADRAALVLQNIMQYLQENRETGIAWFRTPQQGWWYWWNNDIETNAWILRAVVRIDPKSDVAPRLVKWLLENRRNGYYWRSTRDTTLCVSAMSDFVVATGEGQPDYTLTLSLDGGAVEKKVRISKDNFFTYDNQMLVEGVALAGGKHTLTITKDGPGALYWSAYVRYFTKEQDIKASGLQFKVDRRYFVLKQIPFEVKVEGAQGQPLVEQRLRYERVPLKEGDKIESGGLLQVELQVDADNDYTYLVFEDPKPAGCEPVELQSGGQGQEGFYSYMELRDEKVAFFVDAIGRGQHLLRYRYRAETPGIFHALPAVVECMYVPELRGNSDEAVVQIVDKPLPAAGGR